jgi:hypothetical protein
MAGLLISPVSRVPSAFASVALLAQNLKIGFVKSETRVQRARLDVINFDRYPGAIRQTVSRPSPATLAFRTALL